MTEPVAVPADPVYLVDDDTALRHELADALEEAGYAVQGFSSGEAFLEVEGGLAPGCVVLDLTMPGMNGMQVHTALVDRKSRHVVVMLTGTGSIATAVAALRTGVVDFVEKPVELDTLKACIEIAQVRRMTVAATREKLAAARERFAPLTPRELEVVYGMMLGQSAKMTARRLDLSFRTVESYRANLMVKLGVRTLAEVVRMAIEAEIAPTGPVLED
ncbi:response regulator [Sphingomonas sp.]|jgi:two-component system, LuxR family, response regulator FixJ|uniref:response regulator transcription factor n=1 Tax=Sphingomonas sp. TaxID=28214 RepID=UPI00179A57D9|nr:response regulator [Sphingomonas sp.]MBA4760986.1 response regulator transcription factor [Sphingomonas sp.]